jgi:hypothetical protein
MDPLCFVPRLLTLLGPYKTLIPPDAVAKRSRFFPGARLESANKTQWPPSARTFRIGDQHVSPRVRSPQ